MIIEHIFFHNIIILPSVTKQYGPYLQYVFPPYSSYFKILKIA